MENVKRDAWVVSRSLERPEEFAALYDKYSSDIYSYIVRRVSAVDVEDILSDVFETAFLKRDTYDFSREIARPWLYGIAANKILKYHRKRGRHRRALARFENKRDVQFPFEEKVVEADSVERELEFVLKKISKLRDQDREILFLYAWQNLDYAEISEALGIPIGTVKSRLNRVREKIRNSKVLEGNRTMTNRNRQYGRLIPNE